jgi:hypothetical protein
MVIVEERDRQWERARTLVFQLDHGATKASPRENLIGVKAKMEAFIW